MELTSVMRIEVEVTQPISTGETPSGETRVIPFAGGRFEGEGGLVGRVLDGGTDWQHVRPDGVLEIRARYLLETEQGERIEVRSEGLRSAAPEVLERLAVGESVPPDEYYFRTFVRLSTASERLAAFNHRLFVGVGIRHARRVEIHVHAVP